jgi:hypothetical protein
MMTLLRNCAHGTEVATWSDDGRAGRTFSKVALTPEGCEALGREIAGWHWYQTRRCPDRPPICTTLRRDRHVTRIGIERIEGTPGRAAAGLRANEALIAHAIDHYVEVWGTRGPDAAPLHGDLSCDNLIDGRDGLFIIDWEHFQPAAAPWGFDAVHLVAESLYFHHLASGLPRSSDCRTAARLLNRLHRARPLPPEMRLSPLDFTRRFIQANPALWGESLARHPLKLPLLAMASDDVCAIDAGIRQAAELPC